MTKSELRQPFGEAERISVITDSEFWDYGRGSLLFTVDATHPDGQLDEWFEPGDWNPEFFPLPVKERIRIFPQNRVMLAPLQSRKAKDDMELLASRLVASCHALGEGRFRGERLGPFSLLTVC